MAVKRKPMAKRSTKGAKKKTAAPVFKKSTARKSKPKTSARRLLAFADKRKRMIASRRGVSVH